MSDISYFLKFSIHYNRCVESVVSNWKPYLSDIESLPSSLKDKCLYLMTKRGTLNDDNISKVNEPHREKTGFLPMRKQRRRSASR